MLSNIDIKEHKWQSHSEVSIINAAVLCRAWNVGKAAEVVVLKLCSQCLILCVSQAVAKGKLPTTSRRVKAAPEMSLCCIFDAYMGFMYKLWVLALCRHFVHQGTC